MTSCSYAPWWSNKKQNLKQPCKGWADYLEFLLYELFCPLLLHKRITDPFFWVWLGSILSVDSTVDVRRRKNQNEAPIPLQDIWKLLILRRCVTVTLTTLSRVLLSGNYLRNSTACYHSPPLWWRSWRTVLCRNIAGCTITQDACSNQMNEQRGEPAYRRCSKRQR